MANAKREVAGYAVQRSAQRIGEEGVNRVTAATEIMSKERFKGTCYRASNWQLIGTTAGRGRNDRSTAYALRVKDVYVYPLVKNYRSLLGARAIKA